MYEMMQSQDSGYILIVDDSPMNLELLREFLTSAGFAVATANSGEDAIAKATTHPPMEARSQATGDYPGGAGSGLLCGERSASCSNNLSGVYSLGRSSPAAVWLYRPGSIGAVGYLSYD